MEKDINPNEVPAGEFKANCLKLLVEVNDTKKPIIITKWGNPIAKLVPFEIAEVFLPLFGRQRGTVTIKSDITKPLDDVTWYAETDTEDE